MNKVKLSAITQDIINFMGSEWYSELINLGIDFYFEQAYHVYPLDFGNFVFVPFKMEGEMFAVLWNIEDIIEFELTQNMSIFWRNPKAVILEPRDSD